MTRLKKIITTFSCTFAFCLTLGISVQAEPLTVTFVDAHKVTTQQVERGHNAVPPTDVNVPGFVFCGWSQNTNNVQANLTAQAVYLPESAGSGAICSTWQSLPNGVLSYTTNSASTLQFSTAQLNVAQTPMALSGRLTGEQVATMNPVGVAGQTCVVRWYNGSTGECWGADVVAYGTSLPQPADPCMGGLEFIGWDGSWTNITTDRTITACYYKTYRVKYVCGICGEVQDVQYIRQTDSSGKACKPHDYHGRSFHYWSDPVIQSDGVTAIITSVFKEK